MSDGGKGSARRPGSMPDDAWERTFGKKPQNCGTSICSCIECVCEDEPEDEPEDEICTGCSGSGEGMYDGATCRKCHGSGVEPVEKDDDV